MDELDTQMVTLIDEAKEKEKLKLKNISETTAKDLLDEVIS